MVADAVVRAAHADDGWETALPQFRADFRGEIIRPGGESYEDARRVWNGMIDRRPRVIVRPTGVADVIAAVRFAREHSLLVAVRGGGHNVAGSAVCDDGMVIDLSRMKAARVDVRGRTVWAQAGVVWAELDRETQPFGLATTGGLVTSTGIAGFTLGGGIGWLMRSHGLACDNLVSADVVTAEGQLLKASPTENADLFWGLRGGGGNFGIVTSFEYRLHPVGPTVLGGVVFHPADEARDFLRFYADYTKRIPDGLTTMVVLITAPPAPFLPPSLHGKPLVGLALCYNGPVEEGQRLVKPIRDFGNPVADLIGPMPYIALQSMFDAGNPPGSRNYWKSHYLKDLSGGAIDTIVEQTGKAASPLSEVHVQHLEGAVARGSPTETSFPNRGAAFVLNLVGKWTEPKDDDGNVRWVRGFWDAMRPFATGGVYVNFLADTTEEIVKASYGTSLYERLAALKEKYDPTNFFHSNHNIVPKT